MLSIVTPSTATDDSIIGMVLTAFVSVERPEHFTNYQHCEECAEYDALLLAHDRDSLNVEHVGDPAGDPIIYCSPQGKAYYLPALVRFALNDTADCIPYLMQLMGHLEDNGANNSFIEYCSETQRHAVVAFLEHLVATRSHLFANEAHATNQLFNAYGYWSAAIALTPQLKRPW